MIDELAQEVKATKNEEINTKDEEIARLKAQIKLSTL